MSNGNGWGIGKKTLSIVGAIMLIGSMIAMAFSIDGRYVTKEALAANLNGIYAQLENQRYDAYTENLYKLKGLQAQYPKDKQLQNDIAEIEKIRAEAKAKRDAYWAVGKTPASPAATTPTK